MANTGNTQQQINYGAQPNDGTGDPLRTAFIKTDENFDNVWLAGPVGSNVTISNNTIQVNSTNGNLILKPNGTGVIQANASIVPSIDGVRDLGTSDLAWRRLYVDTLSTTDITVDGNLEVSGNLIIDGDIVQIGNLVTDAKTIQLANTATTDAQANGSGITVGANDDVATLLYNSTNNEWRTNIGANIVGNVTANYFIGDGSLLTGISGTGDFVFANNTMSIANNAMEIAATGTGADIDIEAADAVFIEALSAEVDIRSADETFITTDSGTHVWTFDTDGSLDAPGNISANYFIGNGSLLTGVSSYANANAVAYGQAGWAGNIIPSGNAVYSLGNATNQWNDLYVSNATIYMNNVPIGLTAGNVLTVDGEPVLVNDSNTNITTTGTIAAEILTANTAVNIGTGAIGIDEDNFLVVETLVPSGLRPSNDDMYLLGNVSHRWSEVHANVYYGDGSQLTGINVTTNIIANGNTSVGIPSLDGPAEVIVDGHTWTFDTTGNVNLPNNGSINFNAGGIVQEPDEDFTILVQDADDDGYSVYLNVDDGAGTVLSQYQQDRDQIELGFPVTSKYYQFNDDGTAVYPGNINGAYGESMSIQIPGASASSSVSLRTIDNTDTLKANVTVDAANVTISTANAAHTWQFDDTGRFTAPGDVYGQYFTVRGGGSPGDVIGSLGYSGNIVSVFGTEGVVIEAVGEGGPIWQFGTDNNLTIPGNIVSEIRIAIDNRSANDLEAIEIYSADNILLQARDQTDPNNTEGGDINIYAGDGSPDDDINGAGGGGDIQIFAGRGGTANTVFGGPGGQIRIEAGDGGAGSVSNAAGAGSYVRVYAGSGGTDNGGGGAAGGDIDIAAGDTSDAAQDRGSITLTSGSGGDETTVGGYVEINIPSVGTAPGGSWIFTGAGTVLETPNNAEIFNVNAGNLTVGSAGNTIVRTIGAGLTTYDWVFDPTGNLTAPGNITATGNISGNTAGYAIGYRDIPQVSFTGNATIATTDAGKHFYSTQSTDYILTIANNASQGFQVGAAISIVNQGTGNITVAQGSGVSLYLAGNATSGNRTLSTFGMATIMKVATDTWFINGTGVS